MPRARVVLVHGLRTSSSMWRRQLELLGAHDLDVVAIDLPGHGSRIGEPFSVEAALQTIDAALNPAAGADEAADHSTPRLLVGLSLGGYLGIEFAARNPDRLDGLVAASCSTRPRGAPLGGYRRLSALIGRMPDRGRGLNDAMARLFLSPEAVDDVLAGGVALDVMAPALEAVGELDPVGSLAAIDLPVWLVNGRFDHFRFEERRMLRATRDGHLAIIPGATHLVSLIRPDDFAAIVLGAVAELDRRAAAERRRRSSAGTPQEGPASFPGQLAGANVGDAPA
ncbi:pimeloyl-ACP methyl ester carboxylesterase [Agromyces hippuratus]|uniref:Pimeloyl-ACP methyl ester carboxylesterase n=1 Tax=Agromyces hippuratus TaxID=286438 RepID=A0A852WP90_9MICO|nr:alpha/beta hydrolase [Agromyces hippuratus]NYG19756.1 pimeloyl-ACP methyl ester carboxylesterase [Agromyces hippuratus]